MSSGRYGTATSLIAVSLLVAGCTVAPQPFSEIEISERAEANLAEVTADQEPVQGSVDLYEAMARAIKYNLDYRVERMQQALRLRELDLSHYNMLPEVVANSGYVDRSNENASSSFNLTNNSENFSYSTSQDREIKAADLSFSWNVLDFGLSYIRANQAADKALISGELKRKVVQRIIEDVRTAYWRAVSSERLMQKLRQLEGRTEEALTNTRMIAENRDASPITTLTYERELVEIKRTIQELEKDLIVAKSQLAALMNIAPGSAFSLVIPKRSTNIPPVGLDVRGMVWIAMRNRPELREVGYQRRINEREADAALLEILPGYNIYADTNFSSNSFLLNEQWASWGAKASWHLLKAFQYPAKREVISAQDELLRARELALTMAVMTQVHVSRIRYSHLGKELKTAAEYRGVQLKLVEQMRAEASANKISEQTLIREEMNGLVAEVKQDIAFAALQNAYANMFASMGLDPYPENFSTDLGVKELAVQLKQHWIERGELRDATQISHSDQ